MALTKTPIELSSTPSIVDGGNATAITIDSSENVMVGKTSLAIANEGVVFEKGGAAEFTTDAARVMRLNRTSSDGSVLEINKDGTTVGSIGAGSGSLFIGNTSQSSGISFYGTALYPNSGGSISATNGANDLGAPTARWKDIYLSGGVNFSANANAAGMTSELLDDYETGTWTPTLAGYYGTYGITITQGTRSGYYTKVGNLVTLTIEISNAGVAASGNGDIIVITGLPFSSAAVAPVGTHVHTSIAAFAGGGWTTINTTQLGHLGNNGTSSGVWTWLTGGHVATAGAAIRLTITYRAA